MIRPLRTTSQMRMPRKAATNANHSGSIRIVRKPLIVAAVFQTQCSAMAQK